MSKKDYRKEAVAKSKSHWEMNVSDSVFAKANMKNPLDNFIAKAPPKWPRTHVKVNECDY